MAAAVLALGLGLVARQEGETVGLADEAMEAVAQYVVTVLIPGDCLAGFRTEPAHLAHLDKQRTGCVAILRDIQVVTKGDPNAKSSSGFDGPAWQPGPPLGAQVKLTGTVSEWYGGTPTQTPKKRALAGVTVVAGAGLNYNTGQSGTDQIRGNVAAKAVTDAKGNYSLKPAGGQVHRHLLESRLHAADRFRG